MVSAVLTESLVRDIQGTFQFNILGTTGGTWYMDLKNGSGTVTTTLDKPIETPDVVLTLSASDLQRIFYGQLTAFNAYIQGALLVEGDLKMAMSLETLVSKLKERPLTAENTPKDTQAGIYIV